MKRTVDLSKIMHEQLDLNSSPIKVKWCDYDHFTYPWHFHSEYEIVYILKSSGMRFVGNSIEFFSDGDLVLHGSYLPHMYRNEDGYYNHHPDWRVYSVIVQFSHDFFRHAIQNYPEFYSIRQLLKRSSTGIYFRNVKGVNESIRKLLVQLLSLKGLSKLLAFVEILSLMSQSSDIKLLNNNDDMSGAAYINSDLRITKVLSYLTKNGYKSMTLTDVSEYAGMNESAFCRYFKQKTGKTFTEFLIELRVNYACKLLLEGRLTISQICYECGFNNLSNFNRQFKKICNCAPTVYIHEFGYLPVRH
ncbi:MAG: AraC family transcriptional regulator [Bacteroidales bacterium]|jgi:AraC-like DNA-binding protein|nr:AraC family transcriptional regulator [Bacteroidales bacterium]